MVGREESVGGMLMGDSVESNKGGWGRSILQDNGLLSCIAKEFIEFIDKARIMLLIEGLPVNLLFPRFPHSVKSLQELHDLISQIIAARCSCH
jgi:hypothetical protein